MKKTLSLAVVLSVLAAGSAFAGYRTCTNYKGDANGKATMMCLSDAQVAEAQKTSGTDVKCTGSIDYGSKNTCEFFGKAGAGILDRAWETNYDTFIK